MPWALSLALARDGRMRLARIEMVAMTTRSSINVNPRRVAKNVFIFIHLLQGKIREEVARNPGEISRSTQAAKRPPEALARSARCRRCIRWRAKAHREKRRRC